MTVSVIIKGLVQGVGFRYFIKEKADSLNINGWVKNMRDGSLAMELSGSEESIKKMIGYCQKGPSAAEITNVAVVREKEKIFEKFSILIEEDY